MNSKPNQLVTLSLVAAVSAQVACNCPNVCAAEAASSSADRGDSHRVVHGWPSLPEGVFLGQVSGLGLDSQDDVLVFRRGRRIWLRPEQVTSEPLPEACVLHLSGKTGKQLAKWGDDFFVIPHGLAVDPQDNVWLTDVGRHQVFKFSRNGKLLLLLGEDRVPGDDKTHFNKPTDLAVAPDGSFYVSDGYGNSRVVKFSADGKFQFQWGSKGAKPGEFDTPHGLALDAQGRVYVADRSNARVQVFDGAGKFLAEWKGAHLGRPWAITVAPDGTVFVVDGGDLRDSGDDHAKVIQLTTEGKVLGSFGSFGKYDGQLCWPHDLAVARDGSVYVGDVFVGMRVQKFAPRRR
jgi:peptidylamidoglycolate lyase